MFCEKEQVYEGSSAGSMDECSFLRDRYAISEWGTKHVVQAVKHSPETDVAKQTTGSTVFYSDKSTIRVEQPAQNLSCLIQLRQVPVGQVPLATKVHSRNAP